MILVTQNADKYEIRFKYDLELVQLVKNVPGRVWNPEQKFWSIPLARLGFLIAQLRGTKYESQLNVQSNENINVNASIDEPNKIPNIDISDVHLYVQKGMNVFEHQKDMIKFAKWRYENGLKSGFILADEPGCISGNAKVEVIDLRGNWKVITLSKLYEEFQNGSIFRIQAKCGFRVDYFPVANVIDKGERETVTVVTQNHEITCTPDHQLYSLDHPHNWVQAQRLEVGDFILISEYDLDFGEARLKEEQVVDIIDRKYPDHVYDVTIGHPIVHNFVANGIVVHNCGKTNETMNWAMYMKEKYSAKYCLIIACVNSAKYNWREDIKKHTNGREVPYILGSRIRRDGSINFSTGSQEKLDDLNTLTMYGKKDQPLPYFIILNIEAIRMRTGKLYPIANRLIELINRGDINIVALDEVHHGLSAQSLQGKQMLRIKKEVKAQIQWIPMTGTPIVSKPTDVFLPLRLVDGHNSSSYYQWCQKYCIYGGFGGHEIIGYKNIPELKSILQPNMLRRLKRDILDLPPKLHYTEYIENSSYQQKLYDKILKEMISGRESIVKSLNPLSKFLHLRQVNGSPELVDSSLNPDSKDYLNKNAKLQRLLELLDDILAEPNEKVVIFSNWVEPLRTLYKFISKRYKVCCYTGTMSADDREKHKQAFINNPERRVMLGTVGALGTSHTLTVARNVIFYDSPWNPADIEQAEDRCHRPGTSDSVFVYTLITQGTVDEKVHEILSKKEGTANYIVDNQLDLRSHPELFDMLLRN